MTNRFTSTVKYDAYKASRSSRLIGRSFDRDVRFHRREGNDRGRNEGRVRSIPEHGKKERRKDLRSWRTTDQGEAKAPCSRQSREPFSPNVTYQDRCQVFSGYLLKKKRKKRNSRRGEYILVVYSIENSNVRSFSCHSTIRGHSYHTYQRVPETLERRRHYWCCTSYATIFRSIPECRCTSSRTFIFAVAESYGIIHYNQIDRSCLRYRIPKKSILIINNERFHYVQFWKLKILTTWNLWCMPLNSSPNNLTISANLLHLTASCVKRELFSDRSSSPAV